MNADLGKLYRARDIVYRYEQDAANNSAVHASIARHKAPFEKKKNKAVSRLKTSITIQSFLHFFLTRGLFILLATALALGAFVFLGQTFVPELLYFEMDPFVESVREWGTENPDRIPNLLIMANLKHYKNSEAIAHFASDAFAVDCLAFLIGSMIWMTLASSIVISLFEKKKPNSLVLLLDLIAIVALMVKLMISCYGIIGPIIGVIWMAFSGIRLMWVCGIPLMIPFFMVQVILTVGLTTYSHVAAKHKKSVAPKLPSVLATKNKIKEAEEEFKKRSKAIYDAHKHLEVFDAKNTEAYHKLEAYLRNYTTVNSLIWAIENGYAANIIGARNYWDRKAHEATVKKQLASIESTSQKALAEARAAREAAEAPIEVTVYYR